MCHNFSVFVFSQSPGSLPPSHLMSWSFYKELLEGSHQGTPLRAQQIEKQAGIGQKGAKNNQGLGEMSLTVWPQPHCSLLPQDGVRHALGLLRQSERRAQVVHKEIFCLYPVGCGKGFPKRS